jgi:hypothetical protein
MAPRTARRRESISPCSTPVDGVDLMRKPPKSVDKELPDGDAAEESSPTILEPTKAKTNWLVALGEDL